MGTVPIMAGDCSISFVRKARVLPEFDRSMMASAPSSRATATFSHSVASSAKSPEIPRFTFTLVVSGTPSKVEPTPPGVRLAWWMLAGMATRPAATAARMASGARPSAAATAAIWGVTMPARA